MFRPKIQFGDQVTNCLQEQLILTELGSVCAKFLPPQWWVLTMDDEEEVLLPFSRGTESIARLGLWGRGIPFRLEVPCPRVCKGQVA